MDEAVQRVWGTLEGVIDAGPIAVAFSGGVDSTVLMHAVAARRIDGVRAIHVNHGLAAQAGAWEEHCRSFAAEMGVEFCPARVTVAPGNVEAAARRARYAAWRDMLRADEILLLAHHADDQAETLLWQTFTGRAAVGMPSTRPLGRGCVKRPLLGLRRSSLVAYAGHLGLRWVEDASNRDQRHDRNYIRHTVLPVIEHRFPDVVETLAKHSLHRALHRASGESWVREAALRDWLGVGVGDDTVRELARQSLARPDASPVLQLPDGRQVRRYRNRLYILPRAAHPIGAAQLPPIAVGDDVRLDAGALRWRRARWGLPAGRSFSICFRSGGERIEPVGRGVHKSLKALFQERHVPPWRRNVWPLLFADGRLAAVPSIAVAATDAVEDGWEPIWQYNQSTSFELV